MDTIARREGRQTERIRDLALQIHELEADLNNFIDHLRFQAAAAAGTQESLLSLLPDEEEDDES